MPNSPAMQDILERQRAAFTAARPEALSVRRDRLERLIALSRERGEALAKAMSADFGHRSVRQSMLSDLAPGVTAAKYCLKHLSGWAKPERRSVPFPLGLLGAKAEIRYEAKGVVGIVSPWNFPVGLTISPLAQALAAGNRAMIKPSEFTERTSEAMAQAFAAFFAEDEVAVVLGGPEVGQAFCKLAFDHLLFTGATSIGKHVLHAAADNLVPVTLELGGKSPTILGKGADLKRAGERIALGKMMNAGQICLAPDYLLVSAEREGEAIEAIRQGVTAMYPRCCRTKTTPR